MMYRIRAQYEREFECVSTVRAVISTAIRYASCIERAQRANRFFWRFQGLLDAIKHQKNDRESARQDK
jgi:hypothetical protein